MAREQVLVRGDNGIIFSELLIFVKLSQFHNFEYCTRKIHQYNLSSHLYMCEKLKLAISNIQLWDLNLAIVPLQFDDYLL